jgi:hypothetical protein
VPISANRLLKIVQLDHWIVKKLLLQGQQTQFVANLKTKLLHPTCANRSHTFQRCLKLQFLTKPETQLCIQTLTGTLVCENPTKILPFNATFFKNCVKPFLKTATEVTKLSRSVKQKSHFHLIIVSTHDIQILSVFIAVFA